MTTGQRHDHRRALNSCRFDLFFNSCFCVHGFCRKNTELTILACTNVLIGLLIYLYP